MALPSGFPARRPLAACLNAPQLCRTDSLGHGRHPPAIGTAFGTEANQPTSSESSLHNRAESHYVIRRPVADRECVDTNRVGEATATVRDVASFCFGGLFRRLLLFCPRAGENARHSVIPFVTGILEEWFRTLRH